MVGDESGIDANGRLWLNRHHTRYNWADQLVSLDTDSIRVKMHESRRIQNLEKEAADAAGLRMVYTSGKYQNNPAYSDFLQVSCAIVLTRPC